ncbi:uncharacterized protein LOC119666002 [Teleopsis dalmanni]|uniref:uncharacterized protein LOC119666002 n=1 Tax=Teleopsis dalmanni TaxID=139649 RepID=UPI0018CEBD9D|nr:uncharacterized protein LOC119666002 [Teleopsis dalmanni]
MPRIISAQPTQCLDTSGWSIPQNIKLADPDFANPNQIDLLIGAEFYHSFLSIGQIKIGEGLPALQNTVFGWICSGKVSNGNQKLLTCGMCSEADDEALDNILTKFWQLEEINQTDDKFTDAEKKCEESFAQNTHHNHEGRFVVKLPFKEDTTVLGESMQMSMNRFFSLERRLLKNSELKKMYVDFMREYEHLGHMEKINQDDIMHPHYILPHHCVIKADSTTTKLRVVFDASARTSTGVSLNDIMHNGPVVQTELSSILLRFRKPRFVFTTEKMYRQILIDPRNEYLQIIIWRESPEENLCYYKLKTVTYGTRAAPYLATKCLQTLAREHAVKFPLGSATLSKDFYVDDGLSGSDSLTEAIATKDQLIKILATAGFKPRKWCANNAQLLQGLAPEDQEVDLDVSSESHKTVKTLGLIWLPKSDQFSIKTNGPIHSKITKRTVSSELAHIFDPLGLMAPVVVKAKIFVQRLWQLKLSWDEALPAEMHTQWTHFRQSLCEINNVKIPRHIFHHKQPRNTQIHVFTDASERAYGAAIYIRAEMTDRTISVQLLCSKSRVAPLKTQTIPRLELCAALLGAQLVVKVKKDLEYEHHPIYMWTDSEITLHWINSEPSTFQTFVAHRISKIQQLTLKEQWRHVNTKQNPADLLSRGVDPIYIQKNAMWFYGPLFLHGNQECWPQPFRQELITSDHIQAEVKSKVHVLTISHDDELIKMIYTIRHGNSFIRLQRILGYVLRFIKGLRNKSKHNDINLTPLELDESLLIIIKAIQLSDFNEERHQLLKKRDLKGSSSLHGLSPFIDDSGVIRVGGRLTSSHLTYDAKHPMLLPYNDPIAKLIMKHLHEKGLHWGPQTNLAQGRQRFWPIKGKIMARSIVQHCVQCTRVRPHMFKQIMGNLPADRVQAQRPFFNAGVDFCGPIWIHHKIRGKRPCKAYIAVFCCFSTKAVHLEVVSDLTTDAFLGALNRFTSRRGRCQNLYCDNATNFVGAKNQMNELAESIHSTNAQNNIIRSCSAQGIVFHFIPPRAPHFGGLWEAAVKSAKYLLVRTIGNVSLTYEELETVVTQIESMLNSRPITPLSSDPNDPAALTPGHFLIGEPLTALPSRSETTTKQSLLTRWKLVNHLKNEFWSRWSKEYLNELQCRTKWKDQSPDVKEGMLVIIQEDNASPLQWPLGRIIKCYSGNDGRIRVVDVKTKNGIWKRPIHRLAPLLSEDCSTPMMQLDRCDEEQPRKRAKLNSNMQCPRSK